MDDPETGQTPIRRLAIYVHIPFCMRHCAYCDFNTYVEHAQSTLIRDTVEAIRRDIEWTARSCAEERGALSVTSLFFGGGTPTFLPGAELARLLQTVRDCFPLHPGAEISSEANPGSSDSEKFALMRQAGFNRLSIGVQSFDDGLLTALDRFHTAADTERAFLAAREAGFSSVNLDLMFRLPGQTALRWEHTLDRAIELAPEHLSLYALTLEPGTRFERLHAGGKLDLPDEDLELAMYERCIDRLTGAGYEHYEVSNFARPGFACAHNMVYWHNEEYLGFGPGAVSYRNGRRWKRERLPARYVARVAAGEDLTVEEETLDREAALGETLMLGLRLRAGVSLQRLRQRFGIDPLSHYAQTIFRLIEQGLLTRSGDRIRLTHRGLLVADGVASEFLAVSAR